MNETRKILVLSVGLVLIGFFFISDSKADPFGLLIQDIEINPDATFIGQPVSVKMNIRNLARNNTFCNVTLFCGGRFLERKEITIGAQSSIPLSFNFDTNEMTEGTYSIEATVEASGQQKIFDLGSIQIVPESENFDAFNWGILLVIIPVGVVTSVFIIKHKRNRKPDIATEELDMEKLPDMLNTILKLGEKVESKDNNSEDNKKYIC